MLSSTVMELSSILYGLLGGALVGISVSLMLYLNGKVTGISGIVGGLLGREAHHALWRLLFVLGLLAGGALMVGVYPRGFETPEASTIVVVIAGVLVGVGTRMGSGCTSGHGVCGTSRLSPRSLVATTTFIAAGVATVGATRLVGGL